MRTRYTFIAIIMAVLLLAVSAGCSQNNDYGSDDDEDVTRSAEQSDTVTSDTTERPEAPTQEERPSRTEKPEISEASAAAGGYSVGNALPDFTVPLVGGGTFTLSEHRGQPVFINLFATWCGPCVSEMPEIDQLYSEYGDQVTFVAIDIAESEATAQVFAASNGYSLPFAYSLDGAPFSGYTIQFIPQTFIVDANGVITAYFDGSRDYDTFQAAIEEALNS